MSKQVISRVHFFKGQFLRTDDFRDEQAYHIAMRHRHNIAHHRWGIVSGLRLLLDDDGRPFIEPGMAIAIDGRELIVTEKRPFPLNAFDIEDSNTVDVWLFYSETDSEPAPAGYTGCNEKRKNTFYRWLETPQIWVEDPEDEPVNRRKPSLVDPAQFEIAPQDSPIAGEPIFPVFLGQIQRNIEEDPPTYSANMDNRPYVGAAAEEIVAASGRARVQIGAEAEDDPLRFSVTVGDESEPRFEISKGGELTLRGETTLADNFTIERGALEFVAGNACPTSAQPWTLYQCHQTGYDSNTEFLRIELPEGGGLNRFVVGSWSEEEGGFKPILTLADSGQVTVHGNLKVKGLLEANIVPPGLSAEAKDQLKSTYAGSLGRVHLPISSPGYPPDLPLRGVQAFQISGDVSNFVSSLSSQPTKLKLFINTIKGDDTLAATLLKALSPDTGDDSP